jgi:hypothetical protein
VKQFLYSLNCVSYILVLFVFHLTMTNLGSVEQWAIVVIAQPLSFCYKGSEVKWNRSFLLDESRKSGPWPFDEVPRQKSGKLRLKPTCHCFGGKIKLVWSTKKRAKKESSWFEEARCKLGSKARSNSRIQFASNESKSVPTNLDPGPVSKVGLSVR